MKHLFFVLVFAMTTSIMSFAQSKRQLDELKAIENNYSFVENNTKIRLSKIFENLGKSKEDLYDGLTNFFKYRTDEKIREFESKVVEGSFVVTFKVDYGQIYSKNGLGHDYWFLVSTNWRVDIKDDRLRVITDLSSYTQKHLNKTGILQKLYTDDVPFVVVPPFGKEGKDKHAEMYTQVFLNSFYMTTNLYHYLAESFKMLIQSAPKADTDW